MAATSKLTPELQRTICLLLSAGNTHEITAEAAGISVSTFHAWRKKNRAFREATERAEAEAEASLVTAIAKSARAGSWRAACWLLERRNPDAWGPNARKADDDDNNNQRPEGFDALDELAPRRHRA